jgi:hypothetical protein
MPPSPHIVDTAHRLRRAVTAPRSEGATPALVKASIATMDDDQIVTIRASDLRSLATLAGPQ